MVTSQNENGFAAVAVTITVASSMRQKYTVPFCTILYCSFDVHKVKGEENFFITLPVYEILDKVTLRLNEMKFSDDRERERERRK